MRVVIDSQAKLKGKNVKIKRAHLSYYVYYKTKPYIDLRIFDVNKIMLHDRGYNTSISRNFIRLNKSAIITIGQHHLMNWIKKEFAETYKYIMKQMEEKKKNE